MLSHRLQIPGKALLCWAERQCHEGACSLLAPSPWGCCHHWLANPPKARNVFRHSLFPPQKKRSCSSRFFSKPQNKYYLFPIRLFTACLQVGQSKGTRVSLGRSGQGWYCSRALTITDGPLHGQHWLHRVAPDCAAWQIQHCFTFWGCARKHKKDHFGLK